ncbi:MAG TPA: helix-turn-helix transcriptional regulator, partial [Anseongella sp.]|nr:helix-turn-helix transcriptional regulator [Anseongella sp.]
MGNIAGNLKYLRRKKGLTQQQLADVLNVKRPVIGAYEEARAEPKTELLREIAIFFSITVDELVSENLSEVYFEQKKKQEELDRFNIGKHLKVLSITVDGEDRENIELVPAKASA